MYKSLFVPLKPRRDELPGMVKKPRCGEDDPENQRSFQVYHELLAWLNRQHVRFQAGVFHCGQIRLDDHLKEPFAKKEACNDAYKCP